MANEQQKIITLSNLEEYTDMLHTELDAKYATWAALDLKLNKDNFGWVLANNTYNSTYTYNVGDLVYYDGYLYKCITAVTTPEAFDYNKWQTVTVETLIWTKADKTDVYTKTQIDATLNSYDKKQKVFSSETRLRDIYASGQNVIIYAYDTRTNPIRYKTYVMHTGGQHGPHYSWDEISLFDLEEGVQYVFDDDWTNTIDASNNISYVYYKQVDIGGTTFHAWLEQAARPTFHRIAYTLTSYPNVGDAIYDETGTDTGNTVTSVVYDQFKFSFYTIWGAIEYGMCSKTPMTEVVNQISITWTRLKTLRDNGKLVPGMQYRITDYVTTTLQPESRSMGHQFDVIVIADSANKLNEKARAAQHVGDTYFSDSDLSAWELWYNLDNDDDRFAWADTTNGKGVIYRMIDEFNNDLSYDFKNIQFKRYKVVSQVASTVRFDNRYYGCKDTYDTIASPINHFISDDSDFIWAYTFCGFDENADSIDMSIYGNRIADTSEEDEGHIFGCHDNVIGFVDAACIYPDYQESERQFFLNNNVFFIYDYNDSEYFNGCYCNVFGHNIYCNTIGLRYKNTIGDNFVYNAIDGNFDNNVIHNHFFHNNICQGLSFNVIGNNFNGNSIRNGFRSNVIAEYFQSNSIYESCQRNTIDSNAINNEIGEIFQGNIIGKNFRYNVIGKCFTVNVICSNVNHISVGSSVSDNAYVQYCKFDNNIKYIYLTSSDTTASSVNQIQYVHVHSGVQGSSSSNMLTLTVPDRNLSYDVEFAMTGSTTILI